MMADVGFPAKPQKSRQDKGTLVEIGDVLCLLRPLEFLPWAPPCGKNAHTEEAEEHRQPAD